MRSKQTEMFPPPRPTADDALNAAQAEMRRAQFARDASRPTDTRDQQRSRRKRDVRARTVSMKRLPKSELELGRVLNPDPDPDDVPPRPRTRAECREGVRPCPYVSCAHHLYLDVSARTGAIKMNFPDLEPDQLLESCALDVADRGGSTLEDVGGIMNLTRERIRQIEVKGLSKCLAAQDVVTLRDFIEEGPRPVRKRRALRVLPPDEHEDEQREARCHEGSNVQPRFDVEHFASDALDAE